MRKGERTDDQGAAPTEGGSPNHPIRKLESEVRPHSGGSISPGAVDPDVAHHSAEGQLAREFPEEPRSYDAHHGLVQVTKCNRPHPDRDCVDPIEAINRHPGAKLVETRSNGKPVAGGGQRLQSSRRGGPSSGSGGGPKDGAREGVVQMGAANALESMELGGFEPPTSWVRRALAD